jgi:sulfopyruvate decarboxylase TPP-binding subunit
MQPESIEIIVDVLKEEGVDLVVTLPEEPNASLTQAIRTDPYFTAITVANEGHGLAMCAGAAFGGRRCVFVTGVAGLLVGTWSLAQFGMVYGAPMLILASYRGDFSDRSGIPGTQTLMFGQVAQPLLQSLRLPSRVVEQRSRLRRTLRDAWLASQDYGMPVVLLLTEEVLWS